MDLDCKKPRVKLEVDLWFGDEWSDEDLCDLLKSWSVSDVVESSFMAECRAKLVTGKGEERVV